MKREELKQLTIEELSSKLQDDIEELQNLRFQKALQQLENPMRIRHLRREIALVKTALREFELEIRSKRGSE